jgi:N-acetylneuraminate synthase
MLGGKKKAAKEEQVTIDFAFSTIVAIKDIKEGEVLSKKNIWVKRPGFGIKAKFFKDILGKKAKKDIAFDKHLEWSDIL